jgi:predicted nucleotidyltransferase
MDIAHRLSHRLAKRLGDELREIRLFGSRAKGTFGPHSDYDILIVLRRRAPELLDAIYDEAQELELRHDVDFSFKVYAEDDFARKQKLGTPFMIALREASIPL